MQERWPSSPKQPSSENLESTDFSSILNTLQQGRKINRTTNREGLAVPSSSAAKWFTGRLGFPATDLEVQF